MDFRHALSRYMYAAFTVCLISAPVLARGDKVIPQVADGPGIRTKFDLVNISSTQAILNFDLAFFHQNNTAWTLDLTKDSTTPATSVTANHIAITLSPRQTLRIETRGLSTTQTAGYAVLRDNEPGNSDLSASFTVGISVYYELSTAAGVVDTVSVPVFSPTGAGTFPLQIDKANGINTGVAIVNLAGLDNTVTFRLFLRDGTSIGTASKTLSNGQQIAEFFDERLFPGLDGKKGLAEFTTSGGPVALLALLQTQTSNKDVRYATLIPTDKEALRGNTNMLLPEATTAASPYMPVDLDRFVVDYFRQGSINEGQGIVEGYSWDFTYEWDGKNPTTRFLKPAFPAAIAALGVKNTDEFDATSLSALQGLSYSSNNIDLSAASGNFVAGFAFAVKTDIGNYARVRIAAIYPTVDSSGNSHSDLALEVYVYK